MHLQLHGHVLAIAQLGPGFIMLTNPADHPPGEGVISLSIDGRVKEWPVRLPDGINAGKTKTRVVTEE